LFTVDSWLCAIDARDGKPIAGFGNNGRVSLRLGLGEQARNKWVVSTTPGTLLGDLLIMPLRVSEGPDAGPGFIQAFNVRSGKLAWVFHTIPRPGEFGYETWSPEAYKNTCVGAANCWAGMAVDRARGVIYVSTGSASPDFWGANRKGNNLFADCLLALDGRTGKRLWHYQFVHHDLWDMDLPAPPNLVSLRQNGRKVAAIAQVTKFGRVFVLDRISGNPIFPIEEVPVPTSNLPGEQSSLAQPLPTIPAPFVRPALGEDDISPYAENRAELIDLFHRADRGLFHPIVPGRETIVFPGFDGGAEWGGAAVDPDGVLYINANEVAWIAHLRKGDAPGQLALEIAFTQSIVFHAMVPTAKETQPVDFPRWSISPSDGIVKKSCARSRRARA
jgi:quinoprotein glucose dehydrogenase